MVTRVNRIGKRAPRNGALVSWLIVRRGVWNWRPIVRCVSWKDIMGISLGMAAIGQAVGWLSVMLAALASPQIVDCVTPTATSLPGTLLPLLGVLANKATMKMIAMIVVMLTPKPS
eukprot:Lithocolla_globosa_v1_NODE_404_length_4145_cov_4.569927.p3 type:complete len:116 gc:universal NODE_404_length_4145_cov_4.569927:485-138(-)